MVPRLSMLSTIFRQRDKGSIVESERGLYVIGMFKSWGSRQWGQKHDNGDNKWPRTTLCNSPLARAETFRRTCTMLKPQFSRISAFINTRYYQLVTVCKVVHKCIKRNVISRRILKKIILICNVNKNVIIKLICLHTHKIIICACK